MEGRSGPGRRGEKNCRDEFPSCSLLGKGGIALPGINKKAFFIPKELPLGRTFYHSDNFPRGHLQTAHERTEV